MQKVDFQVANKVAAFIGRQKLKMDRGRGWAALIQFAMQGVTMLAVVGYADWIKAHALLASVIGMVLVVGGLLLIGEIEQRLGLVEAEYGRISTLSPVYQDIFAKFDDLNRQNETLRILLSEIKETMARDSAIESPAGHRVDPILDNISHNHRSLPASGPMPDDSTGGRINQAQ